MSVQMKRRHPEEERRKGKEKNHVSGRKEMRGKLINIHGEWHGRHVYMIWKKKKRK